MTDDKPTIVLIHGLWMTPSGSDPFRHYYEDSGHTVLARPGHGSRAPWRRSAAIPSALNGLGVTEIVDHYDAITRTLDHKYSRSPAVTSFMQLPGRSHLILAEAGWEEVADNALLRALCHARSRAVIEAESEGAA